MKTKIELDQKSLREILKQQFESAGYKVSLVIFNVGTELGSRFEEEEVAVLYGAEVVCEMPPPKIEDPTFRNTPTIPDMNKVIAEKIHASLHVQEVMPAPKDDNDHKLGSWAFLQFPQLMIELRAAYEWIFGSRIPRIHSERLGDQGLPCIWLEDKAIIIEPTRITRTGLVDRDFYGWSVSICHAVCNYPTEPDDFDSSIAGEVLGHNAVVQLAMEQVWKLRQEAYFTYLAEKKHAEDTK